MYTDKFIELKMITTHFNQCLLFLQLEAEGIQVTHAPLHKVWPRQPCCTGLSYWVSALLTQSLGDTVQTGTGKVDPARKFKSTTAARISYVMNFEILKFYDIKLQNIKIVRNVHTNTSYHRKSELYNQAKMNVPLFPSCDSNL